MKRNKLIAYAMDFASFLLENDIEPRKIILFGSVVSGEFRKESDVDIFIDTDNPKEDKINSILRIFDSTYGERWKLKGISNSISLKMGDIEKWPELRRSLQSYGIMLYARYNELPQNIKSYLLFRLEYGKISRTKKVNLWRKLYGYKQKIEKKEYIKKGLVQDLEGKKLENGIVIMPSENTKKFREFLNKNKINFSVNEVWSDNI